MLDSRDLLPGQCLLMGLMHPFRARRGGELLEMSHLAL